MTQRPPRAHTTCRRCRQRYDFHDDGLCADGREFLRHRRPGKSASNSFSEAEVTALDTLLTMLRGRRDLSVVARRLAPELLAVERKCKAMRVSIAQRKEPAT